MKCRKCDSLLRRKDNTEMRTAVYFQSPEGHDHNDNCITRNYICDNGHYCKLSIINSCHCGWRGREECFCSGKVEKWPENEKLDVE